MNTAVQAPPETRARPERNEAGRREVEEAYRILVGSSQQGLLLIQEERIVYANGMAARLTGYTVPELLANPLEQIITVIHPEDRAVIRQRHEDRLRGLPSPPRYEFRVTRRDGALRWLELQAGVVEYQGRPAVQIGLLDVTERKSAEEALREKEQRFRTLFEAAPDAIYLTDLEGRLVDANQTAEQLAGIPKKELVGKSLLEAGLLPRRQIARARAGLKKNAEGKAAGPDHFTLIRRDGARLMLEIKTFPLRFASGTLVLGIARDVTERQRAEEELRTHRHRLRALASELTLAEERERRRIALDLHDHACQDLVLAKMNVQSLLTGASLAGDSELRQIDGTLEHILENVRELTFDLGSPTLYKFGLAAALEELLEDKLGAEPDLEYGFRDDRAPKPLTEEVQVLLFRSVRELLINVLKHARAHQVILDIRRAGNSIRIAVTDDGIGFDTDKVLSLPTRHHGFGLFSIRERLDCIGGRFRIGSQRGLGSRFILMAPLKREGPNSGRKHDVSQNFVGG